MDYSLLTEDILFKRFDSLPLHIQDILSSEKARRLVSQIGRSHYLSREKVDALEQIVSMILLGFVNLRNLKREISDKLFLNYDHTVALANDLDQELLREIRGDLEQIYLPIEEELSEPKSETLETETPIPEESPAIYETESEVTIPIHEGSFSSGNAPLILLEGKPEPLKEDRPSSFKDFSKSFSFFAPREDSSKSKNLVHASVELPKEKKVVHYSELRSPISPFDRGVDFEKLKEPDSKESSLSEKSVGVEEIKLKPGFLRNNEDDSNLVIVKQEEKPPERQVGLEGNKIDLRNI